MSVTRGQCDARPTVTFPAARHHCPLAGTKLYCLVIEARVLTTCHLTVEWLGYEPVTYWSQVQHLPLCHRATYLSKKEQLKDCFTGEIICVVLDKVVEEQRQRLPHTIADTFLGPADHQNVHRLKGTFYTHYPLLPTSFTTTSGLLLTIKSVRVYAC